MIKKQWVVFFLILVIAVLFRSYQINEIPPGINRDEGSIGYTAYSLLITGKDEYGKSLPLSFQSFGDWKLPLYIYSVVPLVYIFGLSEFSVRLTSIAVGIGSVIVTFFLIRELFKKDLLAFLTMILVAISPWHIHLSRVESESNTSVFFASLGVLFFLKSIKQKNWLLVPSALLLALTYYTYAGNYIFTTLLVLGLLVIYYRVIPKSYLTYSAGLVFISLSLIIFSQTVFSANKTKLSGISIFGDPAVVHAKIEIPRNEHSNPSSLFARLSHNRVTFAVERITQNYINSFSPQFLFIQGGTNRAHNILNFGNMYLVESVFLLFGVIYLFVVKKGTSEKLIIWWLFIGPVAGSITKDAPHTNRMFAIFPILPLIVALGIHAFLLYVKKYRFRHVIIAFIFVMFLCNIGLFIDRYFVHFPHNEAENWGSGYKQLNKVIESQYKNKHIVMTRPEYSPYIFLLFYSKYDPVKYTKEVARYPVTNDGFVHVEKYSNYEFREIQWANDIHASNTLLIASPSEVPDFIYSGPWKKSEIVLPSGKPMFVLIDTAQ